MELFTPSITIVTQPKKLHHFSHLALETSLQWNCSSKYSAGYCTYLLLEPKDWYSLLVKNRSILLNFIKWVDNTRFKVRNQELVIHVASICKIKNPIWFVTFIFPYQIIFDCHILHFTYVLVHNYVYHIETIIWRCPGLRRKLHIFRWKKLTEVTYKEQTPPGI